MVNWHFSRLTVSQHSDKVNFPLPKLRLCCDFGFERAKRMEFVSEFEIPDEGLNQKKAEADDQNVYEILQENAKKKEDEESHRRKMAFRLFSLISFLFFFPPTEPFPFPQRPIVLLVRKI